MRKKGFLTAFVAVGLLSFALPLAAASATAAAARTPEKAATWAEVQPCYEKGGYRFFKGFDGLAGTVLPYKTDKGIVHFVVKDFQVGATKEGNLIPALVTGDVQDSLDYFRVDIDHRKSPLATETALASPVGHVMLAGGKDRILVTSFDFGVDPANEAFVAHYTGTYVTTGESVEYQFVSELPVDCAAPAPPKCRQVPLNSCAPEGSCTACAFTTGPGGAITGCSCTAGGLLSWCLWFTVDCVAVTCPTPCTVWKVPGTNLYSCRC